MTALDALLSALATRQEVSASTQSQGLAALRFPYRHVLGACPRLVSVAALMTATRADGTARADGKGSRH